MDNYLPFFKLLSYYVNFLCLLYVERVNDEQRVSNEDSELNLFFAIIFCNCRNKINIILYRRY